MQTDLFEAKTTDLIIGKEYTYCGKDRCTLLAIDGRHVLVKFLEGRQMKLCTTKSALDANYGKRKVK